MKSRIRSGAFHPFWTFVIVIELLAGIQAALGQTSCATAPSDLVSWWRGEGSGADEIGGNHGTLQNGMGFATGLVGQAFSFNGTNQYAQVSSSLNPTGSFSIEGWILPQADQTGSIACKWGDVGAYQNNRCFIFYAATGRGLGFPIADASTQWDGSFQQFTVANVLTLGEWNHVAAVYDQATGTRRLFVNGTNVATRTDAPITPLASSASLTIGGDPPVSKEIPTYFHGLIDELSFYQRALSSNELAALYAAGSAGKCTSTPPNCTTAPTGLVSWWRAEGGTADSTSANNHGTPHGGLSYWPGLVGKAFNFDGTNGYVDMPASASLDVGTSEGLSVECWIKPVDVVQAQPLFEWFAGVGPPWGVHFWISEAGSGPGPGCLYVNVMDKAGGEHKFASAAGFVVTNIWQHVAATYDKATGWARLFYNGSLVAEHHLGSFTPQTSYPLFLGRRPPGTYTGVFYRGAMDEPAIYSRALAANEIQSLYAAGSAGKCVSQPSAVYDVARDFSTNSNPAGIWSYGYSTALGGDMILHTSRGYDGGLESWFTDIWLGTPNVLHNGTAATITNSTGTIVLKPGQLSFHPGPNGEFGLVRFTVPSDGLFQITAAFVGADTHGTTTDVYLMQNGSLFFGGQVNGFGPNSGPTFQTNLTLRAGDRLDFAVGRGSNQEFSFDSTGLSAQISLIAAPVAECVSSPGGVVAWWRAEGGASDTVGNNHGEMRNGAAVAAGQVGQAFVLDGVDDLVEVPNSSTLNPAGSFSLEGWIFSRQDQDREIVCKWGDDGDYSNNRSYSFSTTLDRGLTFAISDAAHQWDGAFHVLNAPAVLTLNAWNHVAGVYDQTTGTRRLYVNGINVAERTDPPIVVLAGTAKLAIGARFTTSTTTTRHFDGLIDEVSMYGIALSSTKIRSIYAAGSAGKCLSQPAAVYDVARDFSTNSNPSGTWSYGYSTALGGDMTLHTSRGYDGGLESWFTDIWLGTPNVFHNGTAATITNSTGTIVLEPDQLSFHPGPNGEFGLVRFTVPSNGWYEITAAFVGADTHGTTTDVYLMQNGSPFFGGMVNGFGPNSGLAFQTNLTLRAGDRVDFAVGRGSNQEFSFDSTGLSAQISLITSPTNGRAPIIVTQPQGQIVDAGANVSFTAATVGTWPFSYQWFFGDNPLSNGTNSTLTLTGVQPAQAGSYHVVVTNAYGAATSSNALLTVLTYPPTITLQPKSVTTYEARTATFTAKAAGTAPLTYQWFFNGAALPGKTTTALSLANVQSNNAGYYWLTASNGYGSATSSNATLTVLPPPVCISAPTGAVAWWRGESNTLDSIGVADALLVGTAYGGLYQTGKVGTAFHFYSPFSYSGPYLKIPASDELDLGAGNGFTIEGWIQPQGNDSVKPIISWSDGRYREGASLVTYSGRLEANLTATNVSPARYVCWRSTNVVITNGIWQHVALTFDKPSGIATVFLNGAALGQTNVGVFRPQTQAPVYLGALNANGSYAFKGGLDEFTIYNRALAPAEIQAIVAADEGGKCPPPPPTCATPTQDLVAWWRGESNAVDSVAASPGTAISGAVSYSTGAVASAFQFSGGYVRVPANDRLNVGVSDGFTIEAWVKPSSTSGQPLIQWSNGTTAGVGFSTYSSAALRANIVGPEGQSHFVTSPTAALTSGIYQHVALTYSKTSGLAALYIRGGLVAQTNVGSFSPLTQSDLFLGGQPTSSARFLGGLDEVSLYQRALTAAEIRGIALARGAGKCTEPPTIVEHPLSLRVADGGTARFGAVANGNPLLCYQWLKDGVTVPGATTASLVLSNVQPAQAGTYAVLVTNCFGAALSSNAVLTIGPVATTVEVISTSADAMETFAVPVVMTATGDENALGFSLNFNPAHLSYVSVEPGSSAPDGPLLLNTSQVANGRLGVAVAAMPGMTFPAGTQQVARVFFTAAALTSQTVSPISFGDQPLARQLVDAGYQALPVTFTDGSVTIAALDYEGDVSPRPAGDHNTTIADWVLVGRYATRLDYPTNASEFQRADCAPRAERGDGRIKITDWVQAGRYAVGLDPLTAAGGPPAGVTLASTPRSPRSGSPCTVRVADAALAQGQVGTVSVVLEAQGGEAGVGFSLVFNPAHLRYVSASLGSGAAGAVMNVNVTEASTGRLGVGLVFPAGSSFAAGKKEIVKLTFAVAKDAGSDCEVTFGDLPVACDVSDTDANALSASFVNSALTINPTPALTLTATGSDVTLAWPLWATNFVLQTATEPVASGWTNLTTSPTTGGDENRITLPKAGQPQFFRLYRP